MKIVQAGVASGAQRISVRQTSTDTEIAFEGPQAGCTPEAFEDALFDAQVSAPESLDSLKRALWSVAFQGRRPFRLVLPKSDRAFLYTGQGFQWQPCQAEAALRLTISHRTYSEGKGWPLLRSIEAANINSAVAQELRDYAFVCPVPLLLDRRRLDVLASCPQHGLHPGSYPFTLVSTDSFAPRFRLPRGGAADYAAPKGTEAVLRVLLRHVVHPPREVSAACLLALHSRRVAESKQMVWKLDKVGSRLFWVRHGVAIQVSRILPLEPGPVSCAVFVSAEGLRTDVSGFKLVEDPAKNERERSALTALMTPVFSAELQFQAVVDETLANLRRGGLVLMVASAGFVFLSPGLAMVFAAFGIGSLANSAKAEDDLRINIKTHLRELQNDWKKMVNGYQAW